MNQATEAGAKDGIINTAGSGSGVPGKAWELRDSFFEGGERLYLVVREVGEGMKA